MTKTDALNQKTVMRFFNTLTHLQSGDDYEEGDRYLFDSDLVMFSAKEYKPYEEETT